MPVLYPFPHLALSQAYPARLARLSSNHSLPFLKTAQHDAYHPNALCPHVDDVGELAECSDVY